MARPKLSEVPECHPDRSYFAKRLCKSCYYVNRRKTNETYIETERKWREATKDSRNEKRRDRYHANPELALAKAKAYRDSHKEKIREVHKTAQQKYRDANRDSLNAKNREYRAANKDKSRDTNFKSKYGISLVEFNECIVFQGGGCGTCGVKECPTGKSLAIDHKHREQTKCEREDVRGILCGHCNRAMGLLNEDTSLLGPRFQEYLNDPPFQRYLRSLTDQTPAI